MRGAARLLERCLWAIGFLAAGVWFTLWLNARWWQAEGNRELERRLEHPHSARADGGATAPSGRARQRNSRSPRPELSSGDLIGKIEIPRLEVSTVIFEGDDDGVLSRGVGHLPGSPLPGERGNVVLAAHRDTFFRALRYVRYRDQIDVITPNGTRSYRVNSTRIVSPNYTEVLAPTTNATLTLVTCYPFDWFGHAPKRFIVQASAVDTVAERTASWVPVPDQPPAAVPLRRRPAIQAAMSTKAAVKRSTPASDSASTPSRDSDSAVDGVAAASDDESTGVSKEPVKRVKNWFARGVNLLNPVNAYQKIAGR